MPSPSTSTMNRDWSAVRRARSSSRAPRAWEIQASTPMAMAPMGALTSQVVVEVNPTAADAATPMRPTWAVSTYCTRV